MRRSIAISSVSLAALCVAWPDSVLAQETAPTLPPEEQVPATTVGTEEQVAPPVQEEPQQDIVVTGSRIPRANFDTAQPAVVLGNEQIEQRGYTNLGEALDELPAFGVPGGSQVGGQAGAFGSGQVFVNFFGLGDQRTLTLVNGRRFVSSNTASIFGPTGAGSQVDFNTIPTLLVDRVETIAVGGAPIYGSDAIAGTVNVITRRSFDGIRLDAQMGISEEGDAREWRIGGVAGARFAGGRGSFVIAGEYNEQDGLTGEDRPGEGLGRFFTTCAPGDTSGASQCLIEDRRLPSLSEFGIPTAVDFIPLSPDQAASFGFQPSILNAQGQPLVFNRAGELVPIDFGTATGNLINFDGGSGFRLPENLLTPVRRYLGAAVAEYELTDTIRLFGEAWYANSRGRQLRDQPVYNTWLFGDAGDPDGNLIINIDNPYLSDAARSTILANLPEGQDEFYLGRANTDLVSGAGSTTVELYRFVGGFDGTFDALGRDITFEVVGNYGRSTTKGSDRALVQQNFENALNVVSTENGIVCAPGYENAPIDTLSSACAPINPFGQQISQAARDYVTAETNPRSVNEQWTATASLSSELFRVWGGAVGFAIGYEHRKESSDFDPGEFYFGRPDPDDPTGPREQFGRSIPIDPVFGKFNTDEVFAELTVPLISRDQDIPFVYALELNGAFRYIDHSLAGGDPTYTVGATFQPIRDLTIRGNYTRSVRAPAITEYFNPVSQIFTTANDPCDVRFLDAGPDPAQRQANCAAAGLPADFQSNIVDFTSQGSLSGNPALVNEKADSWTVGAVLRPRFIPNLTLAVDWVDIKLQNAVQSLTATQVLQACYDSPSYPNPVGASGTNFCELFTRDEDGQITFVQTGFENAATREFQGLIAELDWRVDTPFLGPESSLNLGVNYLYNDKLEFRVGEGDLTTLRNSIGYSKHQGTANLTYRNGPFSWQVQGQYIGKAVFDPDEEEGNRDIEGVGDVVFVNTTLSYDVNDRYTFRFIVDNLFDTDPPFPAPGGGGRVTYWPGILGRYFKVAAVARF